MSYSLFEAVLSSNHTKSSTRLAELIIAWHACPTCDRVFCGTARLAREMNIEERKAKRLVKKLRDEWIIRPTGETGPHGVMVYRLQREVLGGDQKDTGGNDPVTKRCKFCVEERGKGVTKEAPNKQKRSKTNNHVNVGNVGENRGEPEAYSGLSFHEQDLVDALVRNFKDDKSRAFYVRCVKALKGNIVYALMRSVLEIKDHIAVSPGAYFNGMVRKISKEQGCFDTIYRV